jgi:biopolymer transport protein ExbB
MVVPGSMTTIQYVGWKHLENLYLNTTASGANVAGTVTGFPLLVRLNSSNFDFTQARDSGQDIRFSKNDGTPLPYEIERWDAAGGLAEIWVRVDTVYGNNSSQNIMMYWGNPGAISASNGAAVFDTSASGGFQGVWHLNEANGLAAKDATVNHFDGTPSDTAPLSVAGMIGPSQRFDGTSTFLTMSGTATGKLDFQEYGTYTVSAWVETDSLKSGNDSLRQYIVSKGNPEYTLQMNITNEWDFGEYVNATKWNYVASTGTARVWSYVVGVRSGMSMYLYINGVFADSTVKFSAVGNARNSTDLVIGRHAGGVNTSYFDGIIDEVRISSLSCSADWIKLCYMNQKSTDALIEFRN